MSDSKYLIPSCIQNICDQTRYSRWLQAKASAHVRRDKKRNHNARLSVAGYKARIHEAVNTGGDSDYYTGELLDWSLISQFRNDKAKAGGVKYKKKFALLPTVDHTLDRTGRAKFVICSWRTNDAKSDMTLEEFWNLCTLVLRNRTRLQAIERSQ